MDISSRGMTVSPVQRVAVMGGGSWATALAKLLLHNCERIDWYMRRDDRIEEFRATGRNPAYLQDVEFPVDRIDFSSSINDVCSRADILLMAMPSPYFKSHLANLTADISGKTVVVATKGIIPDQNMLVSDFLIEHYGVAPDRIVVISGPCHAEEVAMGRVSYLTVACTERHLATSVASLLAGPVLHTLISDDVRGIEYAGVLKNVYAIASGMIHGMKAGDNFQAILISNAIREMERFIEAAVGGHRNICDSVYLGDLLVTAYSRFSRNHNLGSMVGRGCPVKRALMEMEMVAEGYYGTKCIYEINSTGVHIDMPLLNAIYGILYCATPVSLAMKAISGRLE